MSKALAVLFTGVGTATVGVGGVWLVKGSLLGEQAKDSGTAPPAPEKPAETTTEPKATPSKPEEEFVDTLDKFKDKKTDKCLKDLFSSVDLSATATSEETVDDSFLGNADDTNLDKTKGCLSIKWETKKGENGKWSGTFTWSWGFVNDKKGFIVFTAAKTNTSQGLDLTGGAYLLTKADDSSSWQVTHKKEVKDEGKKTISLEEFETKFPKAKDSSVFKEENKDYWDFVTDKNSLTQTCSENDSCATKKDSKSWSWKWFSGGNHKFSEWGENLEWWDLVYTNGFFKLQEKLEAFSGTWTKDSPQA